MLYVLFRILAAFFRLLPRRCVQALASSICLLASFFAFRTLRAVEANLRVVTAGQHLPPRRIRRLARQTFRNFGAYLADFFRFRRADAFPSRHYLRIENPELLDQIRSSPRGAIALTLHLGNWELAGAALAAAGFRLHAVVHPVSMPALERIFTDFRHQRGMDVISLRHAPLGIARALLAGEVVALLGDRDYTHSGSPSPFFGRTARLPPGPAAFAHRLQIPVLFGAIARGSDNVYSLRFSLLHPDPSLSEAEIQSRITALMEEAIRQNPTQWFAFRPFWPA